MKFRVKAGKHVEDGRVYKKDEVVESHHDLLKLFPEKFELVHEAPFAAQGEDPEPVPEPRKPTPKGKKKSPAEEAFDD